MKDAFKTSFLSLLCLLSLILLPLCSEARLPLPPLPPLLIPVPPPVVVIPGTYAYFAPGVTEDLLFFQGHWYRPHQGAWYRASDYKGPWAFVPAPQVPRVLITLTPGFRAKAGNGEIPHDQLRKNWRTWERERHWDRDGLKHEVKHEGRHKHHGKRKKHRDDRRDDDDDHDGSDKHRGSHGKGH